MAKTSTRTRSSDSPVAERSPWKSAEERKSGPFEDYEVRSALETITRAIKVKKNPALMRAVKAEAKRQLAAAESTRKALSGE